MNLQFVKYFLLLADTQNFTRAAERAHVVQSTFSAGIKKLEESLDVLLFDRDKRNISLTQAGEALLPRARELMRSWQVIEEMFDTQPNQYLRLGFVQNLSLDSVIPLINAFKKVRPLSEVHIAEDKHAALLKLLESEKIAAFFTEKQAIDTTKYQRVKVASEELFFALPHQHPLARKNALDLACLQGEPFVERSYCALYADVFDELSRLGIQPNKVFTAHNNETVAALVSSGMAITLMPKPIFSLPEIKFLPIKDAVFVRHIELIWKVNLDNKLLYEFLEVVRYHG